MNACICVYGYAYNTGRASNLTKEINYNCLFKYAIMLFILMYTHVHTYAQTHTYILV